MCYSRFLWFFCISQLISEAFGMQQPISEIFLHIIFDVRNLPVYRSRSLGSIWILQSIFVICLKLQSNSEIFLLATPDLWDSPFLHNRSLRSFCILLSVADILLHTTVDLWDLIVYYCLSLGFPVCNHPFMRSFRIPQSISDFAISNSRSLRSSCIL